MSTDEHWQTGAQPEPPRKRQHLCLTLGWLCHADADFLQVVQTIATDAHAHVVNIPRLMVDSITVLAEAGPMRGGDAN